MYLSPPLLLFIYFSNMFGICLNIPEHKENLWAHCEGVKQPLQQMCPLSRNFCFHN